MLLKNIIDKNLENITEQGQMDKCIVLLNQTILKFCWVKREKREHLVWFKYVMSPEGTIKRVTSGGFSRQAQICLCVFYTYM